MHNARLIAAGIVLLLFTALGAHAAEVKIGILDTQVLLKHSKAARDAIGVFMMDVEAKRGLLKAKQEAVQAKDRALGVKAGGKSPDEIKAERLALAQEVKELKRLQADLDEELKRKDRELTQRLLDEIRSVAEDYAKKHKLTVVLEKKLVVAFDGAADITGEVLKAYDATRK